jgi:hypothetical protein
MLLSFARLSLANIVKEILTEAIESDALHEASRNNTVCIDIVARDEYALTGNLFDRSGCHDFFKIFDLARIARRW